jgi:hypothetical protein
VSICFQKFPFDTKKAVIKYHSGQGVGRRVSQTYRHVVTSTRDHFRQSPFVQSISETAHNTGDLVHGVSQSAGTALGCVLDGANAVVDLIPGVVPLKSKAADRAQRRRTAEIRGADLQLQRQDTEFVPTLR